MVLKMANLCYYVVTCYMFSEVTTTVIESLKKSVGNTCVGVSFFLKITKLYEDIFSA